MTPQSSAFSFIEQLAAPVPKGAQARKVWSIDLSRVVRYATATNVNGKTAIPSDALGAPTRLVMDKDTGEVKFNKSGLPVYRIHPEISSFVKGIRTNLENQMDAYFSATAQAKPDAMRAQLEMATRSATPVLVHENEVVTSAIAARTAAVAAAAPAEADPTPTPDPVAVAA